MFAAFVLPLLYANRFGMGESSAVNNHHNTAAAGFHEPRFHFLVFDIDLRFELTVGMAYNHRVSQQPHGQHHGKNRKKDDENDALMRLVSPAATPRSLSTCKYLMLQ